MPTLARPQSPANLGFAGDGSIDAVVSLGALGRMSEVQRQAFLGEALRVLRPGAPIIFVERRKYRMGCGLVWADSGGGVTGRGVRGFGRGLQSHLWRGVSAGEKGEGGRREVARGAPGRSFGGGMGEEESSNANLW